MARDLPRFAIPMMLLVSAATVVATAVPAEARSRLTRECVYEAAAFGGHDGKTLLTIMATEGGRLGQRHLNSNGTVDLGPFQINSATLAKLAAELHVAYSTLEQVALEEGCQAAYLASFILRRKIDAESGDTLAGLGDYNSRTPRFHDAYLDRLKQTFQKLYGPVDAPARK